MMSAAFAEIHLDLTTEQRGHRRERRRETECARRPSPARRATNSAPDK